MCLTTLETSEPALNSRRSGHGDAALGGCNERWTAAEPMEILSLKTLKQIFK